MRSSFPYPIRLALSYLALGGLWILVTDRLVHELVQDPPLAAAVATYKGWFFVLLSAALLYSSLSRQLSRRQQIEHALSESEARARLFSNAVEKSHLPFACGYADGQLIAFNPAFCDLLGYRADEMKTLNWVIDFTPPAWRAHEAQFLADLRQRRRPVRYEKEIIRKDGSRLPVELFVHLETADEIVYYAFFTDLTERKQAEEILRQTSEESETFFQVTLDLLCIADTDGCFRKLNPQWERALGFSLAELEGRRFLELVHPDDREATLAALARLADQQEVINFINRYRCKDGSYRWIEWRSVPRGKWIYAAARDITDRQQAEQALRESEYWLRESQRIAGIGSYVLDIPAERWISSTVLDEIFGIGPAFERNVANWATLVHPDHRQMMTQYFSDLLTSHQNFDKEYKIIRKSDGQERWVHGRGNFDYDENGRPLRMYGTIQDITDRKRSEEALRKLNAELEERVRERTARLEASNQELEAFSYSVSHDLRAPLRHLNGYSRMLADEYGDQLDARALGYIQRIQEASTHMGQLIDALLELSRLIRSELRFKVVDLSALALAIAAELSKHDPQRAVEFIIQDGLTAYADETLMRIVLENLLGNAWKFTGKREQVRIEFGCITQASSSADASKRPETIFFVRDNGVGFDMTYANKLFGVFQRLHRSDEFPGTGVGLASVQRIIRRHGGKVWVESAPEQGATFYFTLPELEMSHASASRPS